MELLDVISRLVDRGDEFVITMIVNSSGSSPAKPGRRMIVRPDGSTVGTIGGGALENQVIADARELFAEKETKIKAYDLTQELAMCCGGRVEIFFERIRPADRLYIFGAGHVGRPLAEIASRARFRVTVVDERADQLSAERFPSSRRLLSPIEDAVLDLSFDKTVSAVVCTHDHALDQRIVETCLRKPFRYLGVIGSQAKAAKMKKRLQAADFTKEQIERVECPMGLDLGGDSPGEIAVSVVAKLIAVRYENGEIVRPSINNGLTI